MCLQKPGRFKLQTYFAPTPGLDIDYAASIGLRGETMQYVDIEYCWIPNHEDIGNRLNPEDGQTPFFNINNPNHFGACSHGAGATGALSAVQNAFGVKGMVPNAFARVHSELVEAPPPDGLRSRRAEAICTAQKSTEAGDVLMLEMQQCSFFCNSTCTNCGVPAEFENGVWIATKMATDANRVVVAAAGNGGKDLNGPFFAQYVQRGDSGAIIVGAGTNSTREPLSSSTHYICTQGNCGTRVHMQGWGEGIATHGYGFLFYGDNSFNRTYSATFDGTSGATPLVTAAALLTQQRAKSALGGVMTPRELRSYLVATGTPQAPHARKIGPLPDMRDAIDRILEADVGVGAGIAGSVVTIPVTNLGPSRARQLAVDIDLYSASVVSLTFNSTGGAVCTGRPPPPGVECAGQCSYLRCNYPALPAGESFLTWSCDSGPPSPTFTVTATIVSGSHFDPNPANTAATHTGPLACSPLM